MNKPMEFVIRYNVLARYIGPGGHVAIPDGVVGIGISAFHGCDGLTVHAPAGSYAGHYARANGIRFEAMH